jgi:hypothetical protein
MLSSKSFLVFFAKSKYLSGENCNNCNSEEMNWVLSFPGLKNDVTRHSKYFNETFLQQTFFT